jgi:hypothetical protein
MAYPTKISKEIGGHFWLAIIFLNLPLTSFPKLTLKITTFFILGVLLFSSGLLLPSVSMANVKESQTGKKVKEPVKTVSTPGGSFIH